MQFIINNVEQMMFLTAIRNVILIPDVNWKLNLLKVTFTV